MDKEEYIALCDKVITDMLLLLRSGDFELHILHDHLFDIEYPLFKVALDLMLAKNLVSLFDNDTCIRALPAATEYLINHAANISYQSDGYLFRRPIVPINGTQITEQDISSYWSYGENKLAKMSSYLHVSGFTESQENFYNVFVLDGIKCNWLKMHTSLLYLLWYIQPVKPKYISASVRIFSKGRFLINGKQKSDKLIDATAAKVKPHLESDTSLLRGQYYEILTICQNTLL